ncbi:PLP-dependent aminotransferase family protein [uncultured Bartonella sp.]|uniref:MocR-like pyridoxine biosynthesis transcription factor PdxR n=1 Tax=uncultured Bartonella sp. TaxID=104108 RepID=UPI00261C9823|nr:PLP-dependent aminotransferase family protein [uncultured Bartonella sp.]
MVQKRATSYQKNQTNSSDWSAMIPFVLEKGRRAASVYRAIKQAIESGKLERGAKLPPSRDLTKRFSLSRTSIVAAYEMLIADGYVVTKMGSGSFVAERAPQLKEFFYGVPEQEPARSNQLCAVNMPLEDAKTMTVFRRLLNRRAAQLNNRHYSYTDPRGTLALREALATYLKQARGLRLSAAQIFITSGTQQSLDLILRSVLPYNAEILLEDPTYRNVVEALKATGKEVRFLRYENLHNYCHLPKADAIFVTPSKQFPLGGAIDMPQRLNLLEWAKENQSFILEDDYDGEIRFEQMPLTAIQGLDDMGRVIYFGTFSKTLFAGLQCAYMVVPPQLCKSLIALRRLVDRRATTFVEDALADLINGGYYAAHMRRAIRTVRKNRDALVKGLQDGAGSAYYSVSPPRQGLHLSIPVDRRICDITLEAELHIAGFFVRALSRYCEYSRQNGILIGYCGFSSDLYEKAGRNISDIIYKLL